MKTWNEKDTEYLKKHFANTSNEELAKRLKRSVSSISGKAFGWYLHKSKQHNIKVLKANSRKQSFAWSENEIEKLKYHVLNGKTYKEIGIILGRKMLSCQKKARALNLRKYMKGGF